MGDTLPCPPQPPLILPCTFFNTRYVAVVGMARRGLYTQNNSKTGRRKKAAIIKKLVFPVVSVCVKLLPLNTQGPEREILFRIKCSEERVIVSKQDVARAYDM